MRKLEILLVGFAAIICTLLPIDSNAQPTKNQYIADFGAAFTQATVTKAQTGLAGFDAQLGKMLMGNVSLGIEIGYDVCSFKSIQLTSGEKLYERLAVIPILAKTRFSFNIAPLTQAYAAVGVGAYQTVPHLGSGPIGGVREAGLHAGGSGTIGFCYYFLGDRGIGAELEYHFFDVGADDLFSYFAVRLNYSLIKM